jgi:hypothetical protein
MGLGFVKLIIDLSIHSGRVTGSTVLAIIIGFQVAALGLIGDLIVKSRDA